MRKINRTSICSTYLIGAPLGIITIIGCIVLPTAISGEGLPTLGLLSVYGKAIISLLVAFLISLWFAGKNINKNILNDAGLLKTSFHFSFQVNLIIWTTFIFVAILDHLSNFYGLIILLPVLAFVICTLGSTFTVGLLITYTVNHKIQNIIYND